MGHTGSWRGPWNRQKLYVLMNTKMNTAIQIENYFHMYKAPPSVTQGLVLVLFSLHLGNLAALWLACHPQIFHGCRHLNTK